MPSTLPWKGARPTGISSRHLPTHQCVDMLERVQPPANVRRALQSKLSVTRLLVFAMLAVFSRLASAQLDSEGSSSQDQLEGPHAPPDRDAGAGHRRTAGSNEEQVKVGSKEWWQQEKAKASAKAGRRVWAWELDAPPGMCKLPSYLSSFVLQWLELKHVVRASNRAPILCQRL